MTEIQYELIKLIEEIDKLCRENKIEYYLDGGTALGAVRHRGFLPWDDDADIVFTRDNYVRFEEAFRNQALPNRFIESCKTNPEYTMVYSRYCNTDFTCILKTSMIDQFKSGLFIDLFVLDPVPDTTEAVNEYFDILYGYAEYLNPYYYDLVIGANEWYEKFCEMEKAEGKKAVTDFVESRIFSNPDNDAMTYAFRYDQGRFVYPRRIFENALIVPFENKAFPIAKEFGDYLRIHYGDLWYMIPDECDIQTHNVVIDLEVCYEDFKNSYMGMIDKKSAVIDYCKLHDLRIEYKRLTTSIDLSRYIFVSQTFSKMIEKKSEKISPVELIKNRKYDELEDFFGNYYKIQLHKWYLRYGVLVELNDELLYCALYLLLVKGRYYDTARILDIKEEKSRHLSNEISQISEIVRAIREMMRYFETKQYGEALKTAEKMAKKHPDIPDFVEGQLRAKAQFVSTREEAQALIANIQAHEKVMVLSERIKAERWMLLLKFNDDCSAHIENELTHIAETTHDGLLKMDIMDLLTDSVQVKEEDISK